MIHIKKAELMFGFFKNFSLLLLFAVYCTLASELYLE